MSTQSHPVQCIVLKCPEWAERSTQELAVHERSKIGLFRCYSEFHGKNQSSDRDPHCHGELALSRLRDWIGRGGRGKCAATGGEVEGRAEAAY